MGNNSSCGGGGRSSTKVVEFQSPPEDTSGSGKHFENKFIQHVRPATSECQEQTTGEDGQVRRDSYQMACNSRFIFYGFVDGKVSKLERMARCAHACCTYSVGVLLEERTFGIKSLSST